jgi:hypothetical protein
VSGINVLNSWGMVRIIAAGAASQAVGVDHCHFENNPNQEVYLSVLSPSFGVIDHNMFDFQTANSTSQSIRVLIERMGRRVK